MRPASPGSGESPSAMTAIPSAPGDAELVARIAAGDEAAFAAVYDRHADVVYGSVMRFLHDREAAEEVVQDVYLAAWRHAWQYTPTAGSLLGWLLGIARNKAIDRVRAAARRPRLVVLGGPDDDREAALERAMATGRPVGGLGEGDPGPEDAATRAWAGAVVRTALSTMPAPERQAIMLAYDEGLTQAEIAERLGWPLGTVKTRTRRGLATLRAVLDGVPDLGGDTGLGQPIASGPPLPRRHGRWGAPMRHAEAQERLSDLALEPGRLARLADDPSPEAGALRAHLAECRPCSADLAGWRRTWAQVGVALEDPGATGDGDAGEGASGGRVRGAARPGVAPRQDACDDRCRGRPPC